MFVKLVKEIFFFLIIFYRASNTLEDFSSYSSCYTPVHIFLLTIYTLTIFSRIVYIHLTTTLKFVHRVLYPVLTLIITQGIIYQVLNNKYTPNCGPNEGKSMYLSVWSAIAILILANIESIISAIGDYVLIFAFKVFEMRIDSLMEEVNSLDSTFSSINTEMFRRGAHFQFTIGMTAEEIEKIHKQIVSNYTKEDKIKQETCPVCFEDFKDGENIYTLPRCNHIFHVNCIKTWLTKSSLCPMCRSDLRINLQIETNHLSSVDIV